MILTLNSDDLTNIRVILDLYEHSDMFIAKKKETLDSLDYKLSKLDVALNHGRVSINDKAILIEL